MLRVDAKVLLTIIQPDNVVSAIHSFVKDRKEARLLDQVKTTKNVPGCVPGGRGGEGGCVGGWMP